jgi:hypothetical protein
LNILDFNMAMPSDEELRFLNAMIQGSLVFPLTPISPEWRMGNTAALLTDHTVFDDPTELSS